METLSRNEILFVITTEDLQHEAKEKIGRALTEDEITIAKKGLEWGLLTDMDTVYNTIFGDILDRNTKS